MVFKSIPNFIKNKEIVLMLLISCIMSSIISCIAGAGGVIHPVLGLLLYLVSCICILILQAYCLARIFGPLPKGNVTCTQNYPNTQKYPNKQNYPSMQ
jgi:hypothetical protein